MVLVWPETEVIDRTTQPQYKSGFLGLGDRGVDAPAVITQTQGNFYVSEESEVAGPVYQVPVVGWGGDPAAAGAWYAQYTQTWEDRATAAAGVAPSMAFNYWDEPILSALNAGVTTTDAATVTIGGAPVAGLNQTITRPWALWVMANARFDGRLNFGVNDYFYENGGVVRFVAFAAETLHFTNTGLEIQDNYTLRYGNDADVTQSFAPASDNSWVWNILGADSRWKDVLPAAFAAAADLAAESTYWRFQDGGASTGVGRAAASLTKTLGAGSAAAVASGLAGGNSGEYVVELQPGGAGDGAGADGRDGRFVLDQGSAGGPIAVDISSVVVHGMTGIIDTDVYYFRQKNNAGEGGARINGLSDSISAAALAMFGMLGGNASTTKSTAARSIVETWSYVKSGVGRTTVNADGNLFGVTNAGSTVVIVDAEGSVHAGLGNAGSAAAPVYTMYGDVTTGWFRIGLNQWAFSAAGGQVSTFDTNGINVLNNKFFSMGSSAEMQMVWNGTTWQWSVDGAVSRWDNAAVAAFAAGNDLAAGETHWRMQDGGPDTDASGGEAGGSFTTTTGAGSAAGGGVNVGGAGGHYNIVPGAGGAGAGGGAAGADGRLRLNGGSVFASTSATEIGITVGNEPLVVGTSGSLRAPYLDHAGGLFTDAIGGDVDGCIGINDDSTGAPVYTIEVRADGNWVSVAVAGYLMQRNVPYRPDDNYWVHPDQVHEGVNQDGDPQTFLDESKCVVCGEEMYPHDQITMYGNARAHGDDLHAIFGHLHLERDEEFQKLQQEVNHLKDRLREAGIA